MSTLEIQSAQGAYSVGFVDQVSELSKEVLALENALITVDENVAKLYPDLLQRLRARFPVLELPATEEAKTLEGVEKVSAFLQSNGANKKTRLVTFGGGILQDISAFAAHIYYRGIEWYFVPTTLLSMADSCIGAKCGVNFRSYKNQLGCFHSPSRVWICPEFVTTLQDREVASGYGEIFKLMVTGGREQVQHFEEVVRDSGLRGPRLRELIYSSLNVKKRVIEIDEYEKDLRRILNYGHTFGHALESLTDYQVPHGLAVVWGMDLINFLSVKKGLLEQSNYQWLHSKMKSLFQFKVERMPTADALIQATKKDKKASAGKVALILLQDVGKLEIQQTNYDAELEGWIREYLSQDPVF